MRYCTVNFINPIDRALGHTRKEINLKSNQLFKNIFYSVFANALNLLISTVLIFVVPKNIGVVEYGFWQLYIMYTSYSSFFHLGFPDGVYLRYGGKNYNSLENNLFKKTNNIFLISQLLISTLLIFLSLIIFEEPLIALGFSLSIFILNMRTHNMYILQATNRVKESSFILILGNIFFLILFLFLFLTGISWKRLIVIDIISKLFSMLYSFIKVKNLFGKSDSEVESNQIINEIKKNILAGGSILIAYLLGLFILGISRWLVDYQWGVEMFAQISLAISVSNIALIFINAIGVVMFPFLKTIQEEKYQVIYLNGRYWLTFFLFIMSSFFFFFKPLLQMWLPQYAFGISYLYFLFPICIFESKNSLLNLTFLKALRKEKVIMYINLITAVFSAILSFLSAIVFSNLNMVVFSMLIGIMFRSVIGEIYISKKMEIKYLFNISKEVTATVFFIIASTFDNVFLSFGVFCVIVLLLFGFDIKKMLFNI